MVRVELETSTLAVLISGLYCANKGIDAMAVPESVWISIAEKLEYFIESELWDFSKLSFEEFVGNNIFIYPTQALDVETLDELQGIPLYWEYENGNISLSISLDIRPINGVED